MKPQVLLALTLATGAAACGDQLLLRPQWDVSVSTDARIPQFGDTLLLAVLDANKHEIESRIMNAAPSPWSPSFLGSFGVVASADRNPTFVRAVLYRSSTVGDDGLPSTKALISTMGRLPPTTGSTFVALDLRMDCFGVSDVENPARDAPDKTCHPAPPRLGPIPTLPIIDAIAPPPMPVWEPGREVECSATVPERMACIRGGTFLLGAPKATIGPLAEATAAPERLVQISPFALDIDEVTVGQVRELLGKLGGEEPFKRQDVGPNGVTTDKSACTYLGATIADNDALPVNCVPHQLARTICAVQEKRLPTEAEWEYAAGNRHEETTYPWGEEENDCAHPRAVVKRGRTSSDVGGSQSVSPEESACRSVKGDWDPSMWGPMPGGAPGDVTKDGIKNLGGNLQEWVEGSMASYSDPCWRGGERLVVDPVCTEPQGGLQPPRRVARGGGWALWLLRAYERDGFEESKMSSWPNKFVGFRCAKSF